MSQRRSNTRIIVVAVNPAGTLGHLTSTVALVEALSSGCMQDADVTVIADVAIAKFVPNCDVIVVERCGDERSDGGALSHSYASELPDMIANLRPDAVIFDTFFLVDVVHALRGAEVPTYLVSYRFRDTAMEIFRQQWLEYFTRCFWLLEPYELRSGLSCHAMSTQKEVQLPPLAWPNARPAKHDNHNHVLVTRGGGGQAGTENAFGRILECLSKDIELSTVLVRGPFGSELGQTGSWRRVCSHLEHSEFLDLLRSASLVVSEAGYNTCFELACLGSRALLVPGPRRTDNQELRAVKLSTLPGFRYVLPEHPHKITTEFLRECLRPGDIICPPERRAVCGAQLLCTMLKEQILA